MKFKGSASDSVSYMANDASMIHSVLTGGTSRQETRRPATVVRIRVGKLIFFIGLNIFFILPFLFPTDIYSSVLKTWRYYIAAYLCIVIGAGWEFRRLRLAVQPALRTWITVLMGTLVWMAARSLIVGEPPLYIFWNGVVYLSLIVMALLGQSGTIWKSLNWLFIAHTLVGSIYVLINILYSDIVRRESLMSMQGINAILGTGNIIPPALYAVPFLIFSFPKQPRFGKLIAAIGYIATALFFIFWQSRLGSILLVVQLSILLVLLSRGIRLHLFHLSRVLRLIIVTGFILVVVVNFTTLSRGLGDRLSRGVSFLSDNWMIGGSIHRTTVENPRILEATVVLQQLSWDEWLAGRGIAAKWQDQRMYEGEVRNMVHIGYVHYIFCGGIMLLILMLFPVAWGMRAMIKSHEVLTMAAGALWIQYSIMMLGYGFPTASMTWLVMGLTLGKCAGIETRTPLRQTRKFIHF